MWIVDFAYIDDDSGERRLGADWFDDHEDAVCYTEWLRERDDVEQDTILLTAA